MTYGMPPGGGPPPWAGAYAGPVPARPPRPVTVTLAVALMLVQVALSLVTAALLLVNRSVFEASMRASQDPGTDESTTQLATTFLLVLAIGVLFLFAVVLLMLALGNLRGGNANRVVTWIVSGFGLCCASGCVLGTIDSGLPSWHLAYTYASTVLSLLIYLAVIVLLLLPPSNAFFRPAQPR